MVKIPFKNKQLNQDRESSHSLTHQQYNSLILMDKFQTINLNLFVNNH